MSDPIIMRLQKYLAECGVASRRGAEKLIADGRVKINGRTAVLGDKVIPRSYLVLVAGMPVARQSHKHTYIMLNKPRGYITTMNDENGRKCVTDLVTDVGTRVLPIGRLDKDSEGMLLMTDDGDLIFSLTHPSHQVEKSYTATVRGQVTGAQLEILNGPMELDGYLLNPVEVTVKEKQKDRTILRFVLTEGRNRQIRKMCEQAELEVMRLKRQSIGLLRFNGLPVGKWRHLEEKEVKYLMGLRGPSHRSYLEAEQDD